MMNKSIPVLHLWQKKQCEWIVLLSQWFIHESDWSSFWSSTTVDARVWRKTETHIDELSIRREHTLLRNNIFILNFILLNANRIAGFSPSYQVNKTAQSETHTHTLAHTRRISSQAILRLCNTDKGYFWPRAVVANLWPLGNSR